MRNYKEGKGRTASNTRNHRHRVVRTCMWVQPPCWAFQLPKAVLPRSMHRISRFSGEMKKRRRSKSGLGVIIPFRWQSVEPTVLAGYPPEALNVCQWRNCRGGALAHTHTTTHGICSVTTYIGRPYLDPHCSMRRYGSVEVMKKSDCGTFEVGRGAQAKQNRTAVT